MDPELINELTKLATWAAEKFGGPGAVVLAAGIFGVFVFWRVSKWLAPRADAVVTSHIKLVNTASDTLPQISAAATATAKSMELLAESQTNGKSALRHLSKAIDAGAADEKREAVKVHTENMREALE